jgi:thioredoxin 1
MVKHVTSAELKQLIETSEKPVFCDFWATWCGPCRMLAPVFEALSEQFDGKAEFVKVDVDENEDAAREHGISSIPNVIAFKGGKAVDNSLGFVPQAALESFVNKNL